MAKIGERIGTYEITRLLGSGGMAMVYAARHTSIGTDHALKILLPNYANNPRTVERFRQEARAQFRMRHPNIVQVTDFVDDGENLALVMDLIHGMTLAAAMQLRPGPWPVEDVVAVMRPVLEAMTYAHREGLDGAAVVHRDLKPENVMLDLSGGRPWPGVAKVMDFGIAKVLGASNVATATNARMGTPGYMSPEQFKNAKDAGAPADVWALGVMLWQLLAGRLPVDPDSNLELVKLYGGLTPVPRLTQVVAGVPHGLSEAVAQAMALDPGDRFADAAPLLRAVELGVARAKSAVQGWEIQRAAEELAKRPELAGRDRAEVLPATLPPLPAETAPLPDLPPSLGASDAGNGKKSKAKWLILGPIALALFLFLISVEKKAADPPRTEGATAIVVAPKSQAPLVVEETPAGSGLNKGYVRIAPGSFMMGSPASEEGRNDDETQHKVRITRAFWLKATEVTQGEWTAVMGFNQSYFKACGENCPVENVSWNDAVGYCNKLSLAAGLEQCYQGDRFIGLACTGYRLPTEAEWEYAARAGTTGARHGEVDAVAWYDGHSGSTTHPVGQKQANAWGAYDMLGNAWEWTNDWKADYSGDAVDAQGPAEGHSRVVRGGGWDFVARSARSAFRRDIEPGYRGSFLGFRPARSDL